MEKRWLLNVEGGEWEEGKGMEEGENHRGEIFDLKEKVI